MLLALTIILSLFIIAVPMAEIAGATNYYVDPTGTDDTSYGTGTGTGAFKTIQYAINDSRVVTGDTVNVAAGTYLETIDITKDNLTIQSVSGNPGDTVIQAASNNTNIVELTACSGVTLSGFTVKGSEAISDAEVWGLHMQDTQNCSLSNIMITEMEATGNVNMGGLRVGVSDQAQRLSSGNSFDSVTISNIIGAFNTYGISMGFSDENTFTGTTISNLNNGYIQAITVIDSYNNSFTTTAISDITADTGAIGIFLHQYSPYSAYNNSFTDTTISNVTAGTSAYGISAQAYATYNTFDTTTISNITSQTSNACGMYFMGLNDNNNFDTTEISGVFASVGKAAGIELGFAGNSGNTFDATIITSIEGQSEAYGVHLYKKDSDNAFTSTDISNVTASGGDGCGIKLAYDVTGNSFTGGSITGAKYGVYLFGSDDKGDASNNSFYSSDISGNTNYGVLNENVSASFDATNNWWGIASGPTHPSNPGGNGDVVSNNVNYDPWYIDKGKTTLSNAIAEVWVDDNYADGDCDGHTWGLDAFATIQEGINSIEVGGTVYVAAGIYEEAFTIDNSLTLQGPKSGVDAKFRTVDATEAVIDPNDSSAGAEKSWVIRPRASDVTIDGFTIQNPTLVYGSAGLIDITGAWDNIQIINNILQQPGVSTSASTNWGKFGINVEGASNILIENNYFKDILCDTATPWNGTSAIWPSGSSNIEILNNKIENATSFGVGLSGSNNSVTIMGNEITLGIQSGTAEPSIRTAGIRIGADNDNITIEDNLIYNCIGTTESPAAGITIQNEGTNNITNNQIMDNIYGINIVEISTTTINDNEITGNTEYGILNNTTSPLDATQNWWGDTSGPYHPTNNPGGSGDKVSDNVDYDPWYTDEGKTTLSNAVATLSDLSLSTGTLDPTFASATTDYTAAVGNSVTTITVTPTATDANTTITVNSESVASGSASDAISLDVGGNIITIVVTAQDETTETYTVTVTRAASSVATLSDLTVDGTTISGFDSSTLIYNKVLSYGTTEVPTVAATPTDSNASKVITQVVNVTGTEAERTATVVVTAEDSTTTKTYKVIFGSIKVTITKTGPATANQGNNITYTITYKNVGTFNATNVVVTETYPSEVEYVSATPEPSGGNNIWNIGDLAPGEEGTITVIVRIK